jgi:hypothetical protein
MSEKEYHKLVAAWLDKKFAEVKSEPFLEEMRRFPDFVAHTPFESYVIEIEDDFESITTGIGQAEMYAAESGYTPVVIIPANEVKQPEYDYLVEHACPMIVTV